MDANPRSCYRVSISGNLVKSRRTVAGQPKLFVLHYRSETSQDFYCYAVQNAW